MNKKTLIVVLLLTTISIILICIGTYNIKLEKEEIRIYKDALLTCNNLYNNSNFPKENLTNDEVNNCKEK